MKRVREINDLDSGWVSFERLGVMGRGGAKRMKLAGEWGFRIHRIVRRLESELPYSEEYLLSQVTGAEGQWSDFPRFHGDIAGRWVVAMVYAYSDADEVPEHLGGMVEKLLDGQNEDGSFGVISYEDEPMNMRKAYGNAWTLKGLALFAQVFSGDLAERVELGARRLGDFLVDTFDLWAGADRSENDDGSNYAVTRSCYFHSLDALMSLYGVTGEASYLELAGKFIPLLTVQDQADHAHMYLTSRRAMLEYYREVGNREGVAELASELREFYEKFVFETGGIPERMEQDEEKRCCEERYHTDEACGLFDWEILTYGMYEETGDVFWLEAAHLNLENQIYFNQLDNGGFGDSRFGPEYPHYQKEAPWCCSLFGPFGLIHSGGQAVNLRDGVLEVRYLVSGEYEFDGGVVVRCERSDEEGRFRVKVVCGDENGGESCKRVKFSLPFWVEMEEAEVDFSGGEMEVKFRYRTWVSRCRRSPQQVKTFQDGDEGRLFYGPWLMVHRFHNPIPNVEVKVDDDGFVKNGKVEYLLGSRMYGEMHQLTLPADVKLSKRDVSRGVRQKDGEIYLYPLKDRESVWSSSARVKLVRSE